MLECVCVCMHVHVCVSVCVCTHTVPGNGEPLCLKMKKLSYEPSQFGNKKKKETQRKVEPNTQLKKVNKKKGGKLKVSGIIIIRSQTERKHSGWC